MHICSRFNECFNDFQTFIKCGYRLSHPIPRAYRHEERRHLIIVRRVVTRFQVLHDIVAKLRFNRGTRIGTVLEQQVYLLRLIDLTREGSASVKTEAGGLLFSSNCSVTSISKVCVKAEAKSCVMSTSSTVAKLHKISRMKSCP